MAKPDWDDHDYSHTAGSYARVRRPDPAVAEQILDALGDSRSVLNVGSGMGSYDPFDRYVVSVEPSAAMRSARPPSRVPALDARADELPFDDDTFDAVMGIFTVHHWPDLDAGLREMRRVSSDRVVVLTADPDALSRLWIADYSPAFHAVERRRYPSITHLQDVLGGTTESRPLRIPLDCSDGFADAFFGRPEELLRPEVRAAQSAWSFVSEAEQQQFASRLSADLASGAWDARYGHLRATECFEASLRIVVSRRGG